MIEAAAIESTKPSPPITASQSQAVSSRSRPSTNTCLGISGSACTARLSAHSDARRILSRSIREGGAKATANDAVAQISSNSSSRRSAVSRLESSIPLGIRFGSSTTAAATTGPASGPRPASSQPATGQTPRLLSAPPRPGQRAAPGLVTAGDRPDAALDQRPLAPKAWRRDRDDALWQFGLVFGGFVPNHAGDGAQAASAAQPGTRRNSRYSMRATRVHLAPLAGRGRRQRVGAKRRPMINSATG